MKVLSRMFYYRNPKKVAMDLLGKLLIRYVNNKILSGVIVETEAYFGEDDPASRAYHGKKRYNSVMWDLPGKLFVYMVHGHWLLNVVSHGKDKTGAVLIRAIEPKAGVEIMKINRNIKDIKNLTNGPGKLTKAFLIDKSFNGLDIIKPNCKLNILEYASKKFSVVRSHRIGVSRDLKEKLRFYIKGNPYVSKK